MTMPREAPSRAALRKRIDLHGDDATGLPLPKGEGWGEGEGSVRISNGYITASMLRGKPPGPLTAVLIITALLIVTLGCRRDMFRQPSSKPLARNDFFDDEMASRPLLTNTVARGHLQDNDPFHTGVNGTNPITTFPFPLSLEILQRGREQFEIYCAACHGRTGAGNGMIVQRGFPAPPSYHIDRLRESPPGHVVDVINRGYGIMYSYGERIDATNRWAIAAYIRALQLSQSAVIAQLMDADRRKLEEGK